MRKERETERKEIKKGNWRRERMVNDTMSVAVGMDVTWEQ